MTTQVRSYICVCAIINISHVLDFSLTAWKESIGLLAGDILSTAAINTLLKELGLDKFLLQDMCSADDAIFTNPVNGWSSGIII